MSIEINGTPKPGISDSKNVERKSDEAKSHTGITTGTENGKVSADSVNLTATSIKLKDLEDNIKSHPEGNQKKIDAIKNAIESGNYEINSKSVAQKLIHLEALLP